MEKLRLSNCISYTAVFIITVCVVMYGYPVSQGMRSAVETCIYTMIPSLYAMMICSTLFLSSGLHRTLSQILNTPARFLFGCSGDVLVIFLLSQIAGYPIGAKMLCSLIQDNQLTKKQASWLAGVCFGGGPAFLSALFADNKKYASAVFLSCFLSNLLIFSVMTRFLHLKNDLSCCCTHNSLSSSDIVNAVSGSGIALLRICAMVIMFGGLSGIAEAVSLFAILPDNTERIILSVTEISHITELIPCSQSLLPAAGALLSFGGICVFMQIAAVSEGSINILHLLILRICAAGLTWIFLTEFIQLFPQEAVLEASVIWQPPSDIQSGSPVPSMLLLLMTFILLRTAMP